MPYRYAHYWVGFVLLVILAGFWASYFTVAGTGPAGWHVHAVTATGWMVLLLVQHISIQRRANTLHRQLGRASLFLFPLLMLGFTMIINVAAHRLVEQGDPATMMLAPAFGIGMMVAMAAYITLYYLGLKHRRNVRLHAGYMLATPLILFESPFSRIIAEFMPWLNVIGSEGAHDVLDTIVVSNTIAAAFALVLYLRHRQHGAPWLLAIFFTTLQSVLMWFAPSVPAIGLAVAAYGALPEGLTMAAGLAAGALAAWLGWRAGGSGKRQGGAIPEPA